MSNKNSSASATAWRVIPAIILALCCAYIIYAAATNALPFTENRVITESEPEVSVPDNTSREAVSEPETSIGEESEGTPADALITGALARFDNEYTENFALSDLCYDDTMRLVLVKHIASLDGAELLPRMGYIFRTNADGTVTLLDEKYTTIFETVDKNCVFAGVRDADDNPLFLVDGEYAYLNPRTLEFVAAQYEEARNTRGVEFDYPSYYGRYQDETRIRKKGSSGWGIYDTEDGEYVIYPNKSVVFAFNGCYLSCVLERGSDKLRFYNIRGNSITQEYYRPLTNGIESLGYYHFQHNITRVRRVYTLNGEKVSEECLMYTDKQLYTLPADFSLVSFSDGIILLEKEGRRGYMSWTGTWITHPEYTYAQPFLEGLAVVGKDDKYGIIDTEGNYVVPMVFDSITNCSGGVIILYSEQNGYYIVNKTVEVPQDIVVDLG